VFYFATVFFFLKEKNISLKPEKNDTSDNLGEKLSSFNEIRRAGQDFSLTGEIKKVDGFSVSVVEFSLK
jgi:hypothetical protein